ncbi:MAG: L,D-transpeptidase [Rhizobiales bacterium]|nr:L,D-transpeptidase [Hyphomicrobiales bacterium]
MQRRSFLSAILSGAAAVALGAADAKASIFEEIWAKKRGRKSPVRTATDARKIKVRKVKISSRKKLNYKGRETVTFASGEKAGTIIIRTHERALYFVLGSGKAVRYGVAVGKEGFSWAGTARVGLKRVNPVWTPPPEMIERTPKYAKWAGGMPGGLPINPLGPRAMYLFNKGGDTGFRIHGTIHPESIGTAASSGCIRMLNKEVIELYEKVRVGTKVIVL